MIQLGVIVATWGRPAYLDRLLGALAKQDLPTDQWEVRVVVDGPDPASDAVLESWSKRLPQLSWQVAPRRGGPAAARNLAWQACAAPLIAITDDDCEPCSGWLSAYQNGFTQNPEAGVLIGRTVTERGRLTPFSHFVENPDGRTHQTCNIAYRRSVLETLGGFDERFPFSLEDTDLFLRAEQVTRSAFIPDAEVLHPPRELGVLAVARSARRFEGDFIFFNKHPETYRSRHQGLAPVHALLWEVSIKHVGKELIQQLKWLWRSPIMFFRYVLALLLFDLVLWSHMPGFWWRHRRAACETGTRTGA